MGPRILAPSGSARRPRLRARRRAGLFSGFPWAAGSTFVVPRLVDFMHGPSRSVCIVARHFGLAGLLALQHDRGRSRFARPIRRRHPAPPCIGEIPLRRALRRGIANSHAVRHVLPTPWRRCMRSCDRSARRRDPQTRILVVVFSGSNTGAASLMGRCCRRSAAGNMCASAPGWSISLAWAISLGVFGPPSGRCAARPSSTAAARTGLAGPLTRPYQRPCTASTQKAERGACYLCARGRFSADLFTHAHGVVKAWTD